MKRLPALLVLILLVGMAGGQPAATAQSEPSVTITLYSLYSDPDEAALFQRIASGYMEWYPNVRVEISDAGSENYFERLEQFIQADTLPDVFFSWGGYRFEQWVAAGYLRDITLELNGEWAASFATPSALDVFARDSVYYGVPLTWNVVGIFYNKALFAQAGLDPAHPPATWDEFLSAVQALKDAGITPIALGQGNQWPGHFWWDYLALRLGGAEAIRSAVNRTGSFTADPFVQAGEYLNQLVALDPFPDDFTRLSYGDQIDLMVTEQAALELMGGWAPELYAAYSENGGLGDQIGWFPFPALPTGVGNEGDILGGGIGLVVSRDAPDAAVDFLRYLTSVNVQRQLVNIGFIPVTVGANERVIAEQPVMRSIITARDAAPYWQLYYDQLLPPTVSETVVIAVNDLLTGGASPAEAALMIEAEAARELQALPGD